MAFPMPDGKVQAEVRRLRVALGLAFTAPGSLTLVYELKAGIVSNAIG
jgi:hypothetical protein